MEAEVIPYPAKNRRAFRTGADLVAGLSVQEPDFYAPNHSH